MPEFEYHEFELDRNQSIQIGKDVTVCNVFVGKETVETKRDKVQLEPDVEVETIVRRTVPIARVGVKSPHDTSVHRGEVFNAILGDYRDRLFEIFSLKGATKNDCMTAVREAKCDFAVATALLTERFGAPDSQAQATA
jgi:sRNA-binding carbon storage regulator CsrA